MSSYDDLIDCARRDVRESDPDDVHARLEQDAVVIVDVRERDEWIDGHIPGARHMPRGRLEQRIEEIVPSQSTPVVLYCAGGTRSILAARSLGEQGYEDVVSMTGGFTEWKRRGYGFELPRAMSEEQLSRYSRHLLIPEIGESGQHQLLDARVLMLGAGGLGSPAALYLAAAGVGTIGIIDDDVVDRSNLQRQVLHRERQVGRPKVDSAEETLHDLNPDVRVEKFRTRLTADNAGEILEGWDLVIDGGDNFSTRYVINDETVRLGIPNIHGSVYRFEGQVTTFVPGEGPCYRCLYPEPPPAAFAPACGEAGVLGVVPGVVGLLQAIEAIKLVVGIGEPLVGRLMTFDALRTEFRELRLGQDPECRVCGHSAGATGSSRGSSDVPTSSSASE